jgi:hypothetical protein
MLCPIAMMPVRGYQLKLSLLGEGDGLLVCCTGLIVHDLQVN